MKLKKINLAVYSIFILGFFFIQSQEKSNNIPLNLNGIKADFVNESYGDHKRNKFDIWLAESEKPTPLVIYIHGGGSVSYTHLTLPTTD